MFSNKIEFIHYDSYKEPVAAAPRPSKYFIPKEFKKLENFLQGDLEKITVKKCVPFLDAYSFGYIIPFDQDYLIKPGKTKEDFEVIPAERLGKGFDSHSNAQLPPEWKGMVGHRAGKFRNQWIIKTAPGYSCLFVHPLNHLLEDRFKILAGVVDTDTYLSIINFPFTPFAPNKDAANLAPKKRLVAVPAFTKPSPVISTPVFSLNILKNSVSKSASRSFMP